MYTTTGMSACLIDKNGSLILYPPSRATILDTFLEIPIIEDYAGRSKSPEENFTELEHEIAMIWLMGRSEAARKTTSQPSSDICVSQTKSKRSERSEDPPIMRHSSLGVCKPSYHGRFDRLVPMKSRRSGYLPVMTISAIKQYHEGRITAAQ